MGAIPMDGMPAYRLRVRIAGAVHRAVCEFTGTDGFGYCYLYAWGGNTLAREVTGRPYRLQAGALRLRLDGDRGWLTMNPQQDGFGRGEFHCWMARSDGRGHLAEIVDLGARHYARWAASGGVLQGTWTSPANTDAFVWSGRPFPGWLGLMADEASTRDFLGRIRATEKTLEAFGGLVRSFFRAERGEAKPGRSSTTTDLRGSA